MAGAVEGTRQGYRTARTELGEAVPPHVVDAAPEAYRTEGYRLAETAKASLARLAFVVRRTVAGAVKGPCGDTRPFRPSSAKTI